MTVPRAIEVFVAGYSFTRSYTHPFEAECVEGVWALRDTPRKRGDYRGEEYVAYDRPAADVDRIARAFTRGRYSVSAIRAADEPDDAIRADYRALGYRLMTTEAFMVHDLEDIRPADEPFPVIRINTQPDADRLHRVTRARQILPRHLADESQPVRLYCALAGERPVGWVRSVAAAGSAWCAGMYVEPAYRRRGIATALLTRMLIDDRAAGAEANVLLASHAGAKLYPTVGYRAIGELLAFVPPKRSSDAGD